jgi:hypothetical protein
MRHRHRGAAIAEVLRLPFHRHVLPTFSAEGSVAGNPRTPWLLQLDRVAGNVQKRSARTKPSQEK